MNNESAPLEGFIARHSTSAKHGKPDSVYTSLTPEGVERARQHARTELVALISAAPDGAVLFIGGASDQLRTAETGEIYGEELNAMSMEGSPALQNVEVITKEDIELASHVHYEDVARSAARTPSVSLDDTQTILNQRAFTQALAQVEEYIRENPDKKIVIDFPMRLWGFSYGHRSKNPDGTWGEQRWTDPKTGKANAFFTKLLKDHGDDNNAAGQAWIKSWGEYKGLQGPTALDIAKQYLGGMKRLQEFATKHTDRPLILGGVGHSWDVDAVATYLALGCPEQVDPETFYEKFMEISKTGDIIGESEMIAFRINSTSIHLRYRGSEYEAHTNTETSDAQPERS